MIYLRKSEILTCLVIIYEKAWALYPILNGSSVDLQIVMDRSSGKPLCYPLEEMMTQAEGLRSTILNPGQNSAKNNNDALKRIGQVLCKQLGFSFVRSIEPVENATGRGHLVWAASCVGYEPLINHCILSENNDEKYICRREVGLQCEDCNSDVTLSVNDRLIINNPGFPDWYGDEISCEWTLTSSSVSSIFAISIHHLRLPTQDQFGRCNNGNLEIRWKTKKDEHYKILRTFCGSSAKRTLVREASSISIKWFSGISYLRQRNGGFNLTVQLLPNGSKNATNRVLESWNNHKVGSNIRFVLLMVFGILTSLALLAGLTYWTFSHLRKTKRRRERRYMARVLYEHRTIGNDPRTQNMAILEAKNSSGVASPRSSIFCSGIPSVRITTISSGLCDLPSPVSLSSLSDSVFEKDACCSISPNIRIPPESALTYTVQENFAPHHSFDVRSNGLHETPASAEKSDQRVAKFGSEFLRMNSESFIPSGVSLNLSSNP